MMKNIARALLTGTLALVRMVVRNNGGAAVSFTDATI